jgi:hypothetical protein
MGRPLAGVVVVLPFPQSSLQAGKRRPALVVADLEGDDLILCQITTRARSDRYSVPLNRSDFERGLYRDAVGDDFGNVTGYSYGSAPPEGIVYFEEVLGFYLRHRDRARLLAAPDPDEPLGRLLAR